MSVPLLRPDSLVLLRPRKASCHPGDDNTVDHKSFRRVAEAIGSGRTRFDVASSESATTQSQCRSARARNQTLWGTSRSIQPPRATPETRPTRLGSCFSQLPADIFSGQSKCCVAGSRTETRAHNQGLGTKNTLDPAAGIGPRGKFGTAGEVETPAFIWLTCRTIAMCERWIEAKN